MTTATECFRCGSWNVLPNSEHCEACAEDQPAEALALAPEQESLSTMRGRLMTEVQIALTTIEIMANECDIYPNAYRDNDFDQQRTRVIASLDAAIVLREKVKNLPA